MSLLEPSGTGAPKAVPRSRKAEAAGAGGSEPPVASKKARGGDGTTTGGAVDLT
jgi:hypothetical protein